MGSRFALRKCVAVLALAAIVAAGCGNNADDAGTNPVANSSEDGATSGDGAPVSDGALLAPMDPIPVDELPAVDVDLGNGQVVHYDAGEEFRAIFFSFGFGFVYTEAMQRGAQEEADRLGIQLDVADAQVNPNQQVQQMQDAMQSGQYAGGFVEPIVEDLLCNLSTEQLPANGMMLVNTNAPLCGRRENSGEEAWAPGSLALVGGTQFVSTFVDWGEHIREENPGDQKVLVLVGPEQNSQSENAATALEQIEAENPEFDVIATVHTDFTSAGGLQAMQDALQAHPDVTIVASIYSELSKATVTALQQAGRQGEVEIYDVGADSTVLPLIESGDVNDSYPYYPVTIGRIAIRALYAARIGMDVPHVFENDGHEPEELREPGAPLLFVGPDNIDAWRESGLSEY